jgi:hypothetical protein
VRTRYAGGFLCRSTSCKKKRPQQGRKQVSLLGHSCSNFVSRIGDSATDKSYPRPGVSLGNQNANFRAVERRTSNVHGQIRADQTWCRCLSGRAWRQPGRHGRHDEVDLIQAGKSRCQAGEQWSRDRWIWRRRRCRTCSEIEAQSKCRRRGRGLRGRLTSGHRGIRRSQTNGIGNQLDCKGKRQIATRLCVIMSI